MAIDSPALEGEYDVVIVGSGGGAVPAALVAKQQGKSAVILEKQDKFGGSTSFSGGVWWIPNSSLLKEAGIPDSFERAREYFESCVTHKGPGVTSQRRDAFLKAAPRMIDYLRDKGLKVRRPRDDWPDYYDNLPGGEPLGRSLLPEPFDLNELGPWKQHLGLYPPFAELPLPADEFPTLFMLKRTWAGKMKALRFAALVARDKLTGRQTVGTGAAIQGRMLQLALREGLNIQLNSPAKGLIVEGGRVAGVVITRDGKDVEVRARNGVIMNVGGFSHNKAMREMFTDGPSSIEWTNSNPGDTGEMVQAMMDLGAATDCLDTAWWVVTSRNTNGEWPEGAIWKDGSIRPFQHHVDLSLPHLVMVDQNGRRIANEAGSYMEIGERIYARNRETGGRAIPCWVIFDKRNRERYPWGAMPPGKTPKSWLDSGYMKKADTLDGIAAMCGIDPAGLKEEVTRFNRFCETGVDEDFGRGSRRFDNVHGDPTVKPNPNLGKIEQGPFYAVAIYPGDVGTAGGVVADEYARVLKDDGTIIPGLYAIGNSTASVFGRCYPAAGASIAASFAFGFVAAHHATGSNELERILA